MVKEGPCCHCGVKSTPLWRNGPPDKPVLCNACGSRWRTKGTLLNYTPLHARADPTSYEDHGVTQVKSMSTNKNMKIKPLKRKYATDDAILAKEGVPLDYKLGYPVLAEEEMSNRSSSGSAMSNSDLHFESAEASDLTGPAQSVVWDSAVPSRKSKMTSVIRPEQSSVEKLTKDLHEIMHGQQSSYFSESCEGDLLFESATPMCSFEIGYGTVILRDPSSVTGEEESEASSLSVDQKLHKAGTAYPHAADIPSHRGGKVGDLPCPIPRAGKRKKPVEPEPGSGQQQLKSNIAQRESLQILGNHNQTLAAINLKDNIDDEELQLLKHLPCGDEAQLANRLLVHPSMQQSVNTLNFCCKNLVKDTNYLRPPL